METLILCHLNWTTTLSIVTFKRTLNIIGSLGICFRQAPIEFVVTATIVVSSTKLSV